MTLNWRCLLLLTVIHLTLASSTPVRSNDDKTANLKSLNFRFTRTVVADLPKCSNGHFVEVVLESQSWEGAMVKAHSSVYQGKSGALAKVSDQSTVDCVKALVLNG